MCIVGVLSDPCSGRGGEAFLEMKSARPHQFSWVMTVQFLLLGRSLAGFIPPEKHYKSCRGSFTCGNEIAGVGYPFRDISEPPHCGHPSFVLSCDYDSYVITTKIADLMYRVLDIRESDQVMRLVRADIELQSCTNQFKSTTLDYSLFEYAPASQTNYTFLYGCPSWKNQGFRPVKCRSGGDGGIFTDVYVLPENQIPGICSESVVVPGETTGKGWKNSTENVETIKRGFKIRWKIDRRKCKECRESKGKCGFDYARNGFVCFCPNPPLLSDVCSKASSDEVSTVKNPFSGKASWKKGLAIGLIIAGAVVLGGGSLGCMLFLSRQRSKSRIASKSDHKWTNLTKSILSSPISKSDLGGGDSHFGVHVFNFNELEAATNNFDPSRELGDGGFGTVYYGVLGDGRAVAVKRLYENKVKRVEWFMNEVKILTRLRHKNLVMLYGCTSKSSRDLLLVYEYIENGTVADHLHGARAKSGLLSWPVRFNIALETAAALAYLHESDIIHRDVKTDNILLDRDFHVKVADFGLSRLFPTGVSHVSTAPQGTPVYVDPEYYQCYRLTEKSDVYSFGVMLIELMSSLHAVDINRHRRDINLSNMAINKIQNGELYELVDPNVGFETNSDVKRTITLVAELAFRCLQQERDMRPSMEEVLETLRGIQNEDFNSLKAEIVDISVQEDASSSTP